MCTLVGKRSTPLRRQQARASATTRRHTVLAFGQLAALLAAQRVARVFLGVLYDKVGRLAHLLPLGAGAKGAHLALVPPHRLRVVRHKHLPADERALVLLCVERW